MIWNPYHIYRARKAGKSLYLVWRGLRFGITFGSSIKQVTGRFKKWKAVCLIGS